MCPRCSRSQEAATVRCARVPTAEPDVDRGAARRTEVDPEVLGGIEGLIRFEEWYDDLAADLMGGNGEPPARAAA